MTAKHQFEISELADLLPIATAREAVAIHALLEHANGPRAAAAAGITLTALHQRITTVRRRAQRAAGVPPMPGMYPRQVTTGPDGDVTSVQHRREQIAPDEGVPPGHVVKGVSQLIDGEGRELLRWTKTDREKLDAWNAFAEAARAQVSEYRGVGGTTQIAPLVYGDQLTVYAIGDAHCGMVAWGPEAGKDFDLKIWRRELQSALDLLMAQTLPTEHCTILNVGDWFHVENAGFTTPTGGNRLDGDTRMGKIVRVGLDTMRWAIDRALQRHALVRVINVKGNHDPQLSVLFNMWLQSVYENDPRVIVPDNFAARAYERFGSNLLGYTHGEGQPIANLPGVMASEEKAQWGVTDLHMWLTGHVHHKRQMKQQEYPSCLVESFQTMAPKDAWHSWKAFLSAQGVEALTFHRKYGLKGRTYVGLAEVEDSHD